MTRGGSGGRQRRRVVGAALLVTLLALSSAACGSGEVDSVRASAEPTAIAGHECAVCGMLAHAQPPPRGQVLHRDDARLFFCSLGDLLVHLSAPSPHGRAVEIFVESIEPAADVTHLDAGERPWLRAEQAVFVLGVPRRKVMGEPILAYRDREAAESVAGQHTGAVVVGFEALQRWWREREAQR